MNQSESVQAIAKATGRTPKEVKQFFEALATLAGMTVRSMDELVLPGLGKLVAQKRAARTARNPATGETVKVPAKRVVKFRVAKPLRDIVAVPGRGKGVALKRPQGGA